MLNVVSIKQNTKLLDIAFSFVIRVTQKTVINGIGVSIRKKQRKKKLQDRIKITSSDSYEKRLIDLGCSEGGWLHDYKQMTFKKIIGIDISKERSSIAKKRGYDKTHVCNAYELPFDDSSESCIISNGMIVHVLQDSDRFKIFKEVKRVLKKDGIFIFDFTNAFAHGYSQDVTIRYCRYTTLDTIKKMVYESGLKIEHIMPSYYTIPRLGAKKELINISTKLIFPFTNYVLKKSNNLSLAKTIYLAIKKC